MRPSLIPRLPAVLIPVFLLALACSSIQRVPELVFPEPTATRPPTASDSGAATATPSALAPGEISPAVLAQMEEIERQVSALRGLQPTGPVRRALLTPDELRQHVRNDFLADYTEADAAEDVLELALLGLLEPGYDLWNLYLQLYSEQIAGFYDSETGQMYVVRGAGFGGPERLTYAHEFVHALQDQTYALDEGLGYNDEACEQETERCAGISSLIEGDATLLEEQWLRTYATERDFDELLDFYTAFQSPVFDSAPAFLQKDFLFPYEAGLDFNRQLYLEAGWVGVDQAYAEVPLTTEQVLHPARYPEDRPVGLEASELADDLGSSWREIERNVLGEWYTRLMLEAQLAPEVAAAAAEGWEGDIYLVFRQEAPTAGGSALVLITLWDGVGEAQEAFAALREYGDLRFGPGRVESGRAEWQGGFGLARLVRVSDQTLWILGPDAAAVEALEAGVVFPALRR